MGAAALQFSMKDKRITSTLCGVTSVQSIEKNLSWAQTSIPDKFWNELLKLPFSTKDPESERIIYTWLNFKKFMNKIIVYLFC